MTPDMDPALKAMADRLVMDVANLRVLADCLPNPGHERKVPSTGWTIRQTFFHIAFGLESEAAAVTRLAAGEDPVPAGWDPDAANAEAIADAGTTPIPELCERIAEGRDLLIAALATLTPNHLAVPFAGRDVEAVLADLSMHPAVHALQVTEALGEVRFDPFLLNWLGGCELPAGDDAALAMRDRLIREAREHYGVSGDAT